MAIQMRRGNYNDFDPTRMRAGEFAVCLDNGYVYMTLSPGNVIRLGTADTLDEAVAQARAYAESAGASATISNTKSQDAEAWAVGQRNGVDVPSTDPAYHNNAKYWAENMNVSLTEQDNPSSTKIGCQILTISGVAHVISGSTYMEQTQSVISGEDTDFIFTNSAITENSGIDVWASKYGIAPVDVVTENGQCTVIFNIDESIDLTFRIYIR